MKAIGPTEIDRRHAIQMRRLILAGFTPGVREARRPNTRHEPPAQMTYFGRSEDLDEPEMSPELQRLADEILPGNREQMAEEHVSWLADVIDDQLRAQKNGGPGPPHPTRRAPGRVISLSLRSPSARSRSAP